MTDCYHPQIEFSDPVFPLLRGERARAMWQMLLSRAKDLEITASEISADDTHGTAHWEARYTFSRTGRLVLNRIDAQFKFEEGLIIRHADHFDLWKWTRMALGPRGTLLGWSSFVQKSIRSEAARGLDKVVGSC